MLVINCLLIFTQKLTEEVTGKGVSVGPKQGQVQIKENLGKGKGEKLN